MSEKPGYPRRDFLGQCVAAPLAAQAILSGATVLAEEPPTVAAAPTVARTPLDLEKEVESLLTLVDPQVVYRRVPVAPEKNAWPLLKQAKESFVAEPDDEEFREARDKIDEVHELPKGRIRRRVLDWLEKNSECRRLMDEAIKLGGLELPRSSASVRLSLSIDEPMLFRALAKMRALMCRESVEQGSFESAAREVDAILAFADILLRAECLIIDYLVALAIQGIGVGAAYRLAIADRIPTDNARQMIDRLEGRGTTKAQLKQAYRVEYCRWLLPYIAGFADKGSIEQLVHHSLYGQDEDDEKPTAAMQAEYDRVGRLITTLLNGHKNAFDKTQTVRLGSEGHVLLFADLDKPTLIRKGEFIAGLRAELAAWPDQAEYNILAAFGEGLGSEKPQPLTDEDVSRARDALRSVENPLGKRLIYQALRNIASITVERSHALLESARLRIALKLYDRKYSRLPEKLAALVEDGLLPEVPPDPFDGKEFKYSPERRVIWSVGSDGTNDGVIPEKRDPEETFDENLELTWRI